MIKVLVHNEVFVKAVIEKDAAAQNALKAIKAQETTQAWALASINQELAQKGAAAADIKSALAGIAQVPVNARLSEEALALGGDFVASLHLVAAKMFKATRIINISGQGQADGLKFTAVADAAKLPASDSDKVDFLNLSYPVHPIFNQVDGWFMEIIQNTAFAGGNHVNAFEEEFAKFSGTKYAIGVANGTDALRLALIAMGIGAGDEVITQPNTFIATTEAITQCGAQIVFADVLPGSYNLDPKKIEEKITSKTKAILPVHLYGQMADMDPIMAIAKKHNLLVLEDACQAHGAEYKGKRAGSIGAAGAFSLYPGKNLGAFGEAGAVTTNDQAIYEKIKSLREHGQSKKYYHQSEGYNGRMDNLQGAACRAKLPLLDGYNAKRRQIAQWYAEKLKGVKQVTLPVTTEGQTPIFHLYVVLVPDNQAIHKALADQNIHTGFHYPLPLHLQDAYKHMGLGKGTFPVTEHAGEHLLSLPMFPQLTEAEIDRVCNAIKAFYA